MPSIPLTFEELLKDKITADMASYILDRSFILTNDLNMASFNPAFVGTEVIGVIQTGNGQRMSMDSSLGISQNCSITFAVPMDYRDDFLRIITDYTNSESDEDTQTLPATGTAVYYFRVNYNTPMCDGQVIQNNSYNYVFITIVGAFTYGKFLLTADSVSIASSTLNSIVSGQKSVNPIIETFDIAGKKSQLLVSNGVTSSTSYRVLYIPSDTFHATLMGYINDAETLPTSVSVTINTKSYTAQLLLSEEMTAGFRYLTVTLQRTCVYG